MMVGNRETLADCISRVVPEEFRGNWDHYKDACKAAADHMSKILATDDVPPPSSRWEHERRLRDALTASLPVRNGYCVDG